MQMLESLQTRPTPGSLLDPGENDVAQFAKGSRESISETVADNQEYRDIKGLDGFAGQDIHGLLVEQRHGHVDRLGDNQKDERDQDPDSQIRPVRRPEVGKQAFQGLERVSQPLGVGRIAESGHGGHSFL